MGKQVTDIAIVAGALTGNRGAEAMVSTSILSLRKKYPQAYIHILTSCPIADLKENNSERVLIHSATPVQLVLNWFILAIIAKFLPFLKKQPARKDMSGILGLLKLDAVWDVAGVSFIDGREKFLPYNVLSLFPFVIHGIKVFKVSQALGPITSPINRMCSRWTLQRVDKIVSRGHITHSYLQDFGLPDEKFIQAPDISFLLEIPSTKFISYDQRRKIVSIGPSSLVAGKSDDYLDHLARLAKDLINKGYEIRIVAHSWKPKSESHRNNDLPTAYVLREKINLGSQIPIVGVGLSSIQLKEKIGESALFVTSRFHGMVAALSTSTPPLVIGWSHKYREVLDDFSLQEQAISYQKIDADILSSKAVKTLERGEQISQIISSQLPRVKSQAQLAVDGFTQRMG